jgi:hypothetical protein
MLHLLLMERRSPSGGMDVRGISRKSASLVGE